MNNEFYIQPFQPEHYFDLARLWNIAYPHLRTTSTNIRLQDKALTNDLRPARWIAKLNSEVIGFAAYENFNEEYFNPKKFRIHLLVTPEYRGMGLGHKLHSVLQDALIELDPQEVSVLVGLAKKENSAFATRYGYQGEFEWQYSRLDLVNFDLKLPPEFGEKWSREGITFHQYTEFASEPGANIRLHQLFCHVQREIPYSEPRVPLHLKDFTDKLQLYPQEFEGHFLAVSKGEFIGLGILEAKNYSENELHNPMLGVLPQYRRRGVALGIILKAVHWAREKGYSSITAENAVTNSSVIPLMNMIGFECLSRWQIFRKLF